MTVSTVVDHNDYVGNGVTTSFPYTFRIFKKSDLVVTVIDLNENLTVLTLDSDYTVTNAGSYTGGTVILPAALATGWQISIARELQATQETDLRNQGKFFAEVHEDAFDKLTMLIQQTYSALRLALRKPSSIANWYDALNNYIRNLRDPRDPQDAATKNYVDTLASGNLSRTLRVPEAINPLPSADQRANKIPAFDSAGNPIVIAPPSGSASEVMLILAGKDGYSYIGELQSVAGFVGLVKSNGSRVKLRSWYAGWSSTSYGKPSGGGDFIFQANVPKSKHDGCIYFSPTVPYNTTLSSYVTAQGETDPAGNGVWVRDIGDETHIHTDWAGIGDGSTSTSSSAHSDALQKVFDACMELSKHVFIDEGWVHVEKKIKLGNFSGQISAVPQINGLGIGRSYITTYPIGTDNYSIEISSIDPAQDWSFEKVQIREKGMTKLGYILSVKNMNGFIWKQVKFGGGRQQTYSDFILSGQFDECSWFAGYNGLHMTNSPNAIIFNRCQILSMDNQGHWIENGTQVRYFGGSVEGCGWNSSGGFRGIFYTGGGAYGSVGLIIDGVYFEANVGVNVFIRHSSNRTVYHKIIDNNFNNGDTHYATNQVLVDGQNYAYPTNVKMVLEMRGNTCNGYGYTPSTLRPDVSIVNYAVGQCIFNNYDNFWIPSQIPVIDQNIWHKPNPNFSFDGRITGNTGGVSSRRNIVSATRGSTGTYTLVVNHDITGDKINVQVLGSAGSAIIGADPTGNSVIVRTYNPAGTPADLDFYIQSSSSAQYTSPA